MKKKSKNIYLIGVKGVGMTMLAQFLAGEGNKVSGSDISDVFLTDKVLKKAKVKVMSPYNVKNIPAKIDLIIYSSAFNVNNNVELASIKNNPDKFKGIPLLSYAEALGSIFNEYYGFVAVMVKLPVQLG